MSRFSAGVAFVQSRPRTRKYEHQHHFGSPPWSNRVARSAMRFAVSGWMSTVIRRAPSFQPDVPSAEVPAVLSSVPGWLMDPPPGGAAAYAQEHDPMVETEVFKHSTPELYERYMGPLLFEPYAKVVAERAALLDPSDILETATGTGIVTRAVSEAVPHAHIVATDINPGMLQVAEGHAHSERVRFEQANAQELPYPD